MKKNSVKEKIHLNKLELRRRRVEGAEIQWGELEHNTMEGKCMDLFSLLWNTAFR